MDFATFKIASHWDIWDKPDREFSCFWKFLTKHFGISELLMTPNTGLGDQLFSDSHENKRCLREFSDLNSLIAAQTGYTVVLVDENGEQSLRGFEHPETPLYIFGKTGLSLVNQYPEYISVRVGPDSDVRSEGLLHPHQAAAVVLYDRWIKSWQ